MAKENTGFVTHITPRNEDFSQWYTDVILLSKLVDYSPVRGCMVIRPYGYAIWERIKEIFDGMIKKAGHKNLYMPMLIPESLLQKEAEHVEGFAPEVAWVTQGGTEKLTERLAVRPTSETIFCTMYSKWISSWRDLPLKYNQWCSVMRWEKSTRPFLRTSEFLWQEGHTIHETPEEAQQETMEILNMYKDLVENYLAIPVLTGRKTDKEKFSGAKATYSIEAMMQDGKALQAGTSHNFGTNFSEAYDIKFQNREGKEEFAYETSWGISTRLIGAIIMTHGDERGLRLPPQIAPTQVIIIPIAAHKGGVDEKCLEIKDRLEKIGIRVEIDNRDTVSVGFKFNDSELRGIPLRLEIGPRDIKENVISYFRRDTLEKGCFATDLLENNSKALLKAIQDQLFKEAQDFTNNKIKDCFNMEELREQVQIGFARTMWCGDESCELKIKEETGATSRNMPFEQTPISDTCVCCGKKAKKLIYFSKAY